MRILQIAPIWERVPPPAYGGTEAVVFDLVEELVRRGHEVTLWATGDSLTSARLRAVYPHALRTADEADPARFERLHAVAALAEADGYDIIHNHAGESVMALADQVPTPMLTTMHCLITPATQAVWDNYPGCFNTISWAEWRLMPPVRRPRFVGVVYNGIDVESFPFAAEKDDYLLYLSRIAPEKGTHLAIEVARRAGRRLLIAGKVDRVDRQYYESTVRPLIDGQQVVFLGEADATLKRALYKKAAALLLPLQWEEPFGLVMVEAMACGTPVITFDRGAVREIVVHGETGFIVNTLDEMVAALDQLERIDPRACRRRVALCFSRERMADSYEQLYEQIVNGHVPALVSHPEQAVAWNGALVPVSHSS